MSDRQAAASVPLVTALADGGELLYWPDWLTDGDARALFDELSALPLWGQREIKLFGKAVAEPRLAFWMGDADAIYTYSGRINLPEPWAPALASIRARLGDELAIDFNSVLANLYRDERDSMGWHSDDERALGRNPTIASLSLGASRRFWLKHATAPTLRLHLEHGSLLVMRGSTQHHWKHCVPKETKPRASRINLTFRRIGEWVP